jgi:ABC-type polysaccharide/polyol phosphate transport system ATPase subunit/peptidoglycan/LPS O-acetylase OafA/YrhL
MESIVVDGVSKHFTLRHAHSIKEMTVRAARRQSLSERFTALDEVSLTVEQGESLALMGLNGSGKSTLLKLISGVMQPDQGSVRVRGRVAGLIEVGAGLHPDLTGHENIFLNAAILGMSKAETDAKYDEIVAFSEIESFLDTQVKFYSSGMFMRLGFSVAVHTDPEIFLVDEVLAVGDPPFQKKCLERIQEFHAEGRTLVIVSHDMGTLEKVCSRGLVLEKGVAAYEGGIQSAVDFLTPPDTPLEAERRSRARAEADPENTARAEAELLAREVMPDAPRLPDPLATLEHGLSIAAGQDGMALEFGVHTGGTLKVIAAAREGKNVFGFDSFEGLPEDWREGFPAGHFALDEPPEVPGAELVVGRFEDTLAGFLDEHPEPVAFVHVDGDLYSSARTVLTLVGPRLAVGTVIVFDEYFGYPGWREHEYRAWQEYVAESGVRFAYEGYTADNEQVVVRITEVTGGDRPTAAPIEPVAAMPFTVTPLTNGVPRTAAKRSESEATPAEPAMDDPPVTAAPTAVRKAGGRLRELDVLRFVAAAAVMLHHFTGVPAPEWPGGSARRIFPELGPITRYGFLGVELFFLISGFVILLSAWGRKPGDFVVSRIVRLFPAYWVGVLLSLGAYLAFNSWVPFGPGTDGPLKRFLPNLTMLQEGVGSQRMEVVYWTLYVELHFYVLIALFAWARITYARCVAFMGAWLLFSVFALESGSGFLKVVLLWRYAPFFVAGMGFYLIYKYGSNLIVWLLIGASWALGCYYDVRYNFPDFTAAPHSLYIIPVVVTVIFGIMALVATHRLSWLRWRGFTVLGMLTYPLYLVHQTISRTFVPHLVPYMGRWAVLGVLVASALLAAYLIHLLVERPAQRHLRPKLKAAMARIRAGDPESTSS